MRTGYEPGEYLDHPPPPELVGRDSGVSGADERAGRRALYLVAIPAVVMAAVQMLVITLSIGGMLNVPAGAGRLLRLLADGAYAGLLVALLLGGAGRAAGSQSGRWAVGLVAGWLLLRLVLAYAGV